MIDELEKYSLQIIETLIAVLAWFVIRFLLKRIIEKRFKANQFSEVRKQLAIKSSKLLLNIVTIIVVIIVWSIDQSKIVLFLSSILTVLGVAFFAQWSHLSNITSGIIIFFNSTTKIGDNIKILDKEFDIEGEIVDIGAIFTVIDSKTGEIISLPNNILLQKAIKINVVRT